MPFTQFTPPDFLQAPQIVLLKEGTDTSQGTPQLISNINACMAVADVVRTTLGPRGMDKLIHDNKVRLNKSGSKTRGPCAGTTTFVAPHMSLCPVKLDVLNEFYSNCAALTITSLMYTGKSND